MYRSVPYRVERFKDRFQKGARDDDRFHVVLGLRVGQVQLASGRRP